MWSELRYTRYHLNIAVAARKCQRTERQLRYLTGAHRVRPSGRPDDKLRVIRGSLAVRPTAAPDYGKRRSRNPDYDSFHGITLRSISWNSTAVARPNMPITKMPTNI